MASKSTKLPRMPTRVIASAAIFLATGVVFSSRPTLVAHSQTSATAAASDLNVRVGVLGLFHPREFRVSAPAGQTLVLHAGNESVALESSSGTSTSTIHLSDARVVATTGTRVLSESKIFVAGRQNEPVDFILSISGKITRRYHGTLEIRPSAGALLAIVTLDQETAVGSVVAAESASGTPQEALKAQAIAARSYLVAGRGRHRDFDFCDTTHCQFLRNPPEAGSAVARAVNATRGLVLAYNSQPFPAMYTRSCSGHTRTPVQLGIPAASYPYYSVHCEYCRSHPVRWTSRIAASDATLLRSSDESSRLDIDRRLGWSTVPSNDFVEKIDGDQVILKGIGNGHGIGLCQSGAKAMAEKGATFSEILAHYYPNTTIVTWRTAGLQQQSRSTWR